MFANYKVVITGATSGIGLANYIPPGGVRVTASAREGSAAVLLSTRSGSVLVRDVYGEGGYVKRDYFPEDPALVAGEFPFVCVDYGALGRLASPVPESCHGAVIKDRRGRPCESSICCCYEAGAEGGWFRFDFYNLAGREWSGNNYIFEGDWDEAYVYTNAEGLEFVITALDNRVDAECTTAHPSLMIPSYFLSTTELEAVLDCIGLPQ